MTGITGEKFHVVYEKTMNTNAAFFGPRVHSVRTVPIRPAAGVDHQGNIELRGA